MNAKEVHSSVESIYQPEIPILETNELFRHISDTAWHLPPYGSWSEDPKRAYRDCWNVRIARWIDFLGSVEADIQSGVQTPDTRYVIRDIPRSDAPEYLQSVRRAFRALTAEGATEVVNREDIHHARMLVHNFTQRVPAYQFVSEDETAENEPY